jgi:hypothetical protein
MRFFVKRLRFAVGEKLEPYRPIDRAIDVVGKQ